MRTDTVKAKLISRAILQAMHAVTKAAELAKKHNHPVMYKLNGIWCSLDDADNYLCKRPNAKLQ